MRCAITELLPKSGIGARTQQRLPDPVAGLILSFMAEYGDCAFVCRTWGQMCASHMWWGRAVQQSRRLAEHILKFSSAMDVAGVCRCWWSAAGAYRVTMESSSAKVMESHAGSSHA